VSSDDFAPTMPKNRERLLERLDDKVQSGQVTAEEVADLRSATAPMTTKRRPSGSALGTPGPASTPRSTLDR
jgi:hypothetical protein